jgi:hypothetical protein
LVQVLEVRRKAPMHTQNLLINQSSHWQTVEAICERLPQANVEPTFTLVVESIYSVDGGTFMVAPQQKEVFWVLDLV